MGVPPDSYCWVWAVGASLGLMQNRSAPTDDDYRWASSLVERAQEHVREERLNQDLARRLRGNGDTARRTSARLKRNMGLREFMDVKPPYRGHPFALENYGGADAAYPVIASYLQTPILILTKPALDEDFCTTCGRRQQPSRADTTLGQFRLFEPDAEYDKGLSLVGVKMRLQQTDGNLIIVMFNGIDGAGGHWTAFRALQDKEEPSKTVCELRAVALGGGAKEEDVKATHPLEVDGEPEAMREPKAPEPNVPEEQLDETAELQLKLDQTVVVGEPEEDAVAKAEEAPELPEEVLTEPEEEEPKPELEKGASTEPEGKAEEGQEWRAKAREQPSSSKVKGASPYRGMTNDELRGLLHERSLSTSGYKATLEQRLMESDALKGAPEMAEAKEAEMANEAAPEGTSTKRPSQKVSLAKLTVTELRERNRWRWGCKVAGRWELWTKESDGVRRKRFEVRESALMRAVIARYPAYVNEPMLGLYAARDFRKGENVGVFVGEDLGRPGEASTEEEVREREARGGGRHIVEIGRGKSARLIDGEGVAGYTGMQYANDARGMRGWRNNLCLGGMGTLTAMQDIRNGAELLFAYDRRGGGGYWRRWGRTERTRTVGQKVQGGREEAAELTVKHHR